MMRLLYFPNERRWYEIYKRDKREGLYYYHGVKMVNGQPRHKSGAIRMDLVRPHGIPTSKCKLFTIPD